MHSLYSFLFPAMWLAWGLYWVARSRDVKATARKEPVSSRLAHAVPLTLAMILLAVPRTGIPLLDARIWPFSDVAYWLGALLTAAGMLFTVAARRHLSRNWSGFVTIKEAHELITSGAYGIVRHPIYTGLIAAFIGSALARDEWRAVLAVVIATVALWRKLMVEERWMREQFGRAYDDYSARVPRLVPFLR